MWARGNFYAGTGATPDSVLKDYSKISTVLSRSDVVLDIELWLLSAKLCFSPLLVSIASVVAPSSSVS